MSCEDTLRNRKKTKLGASSSVGVVDQEWQERKGKDKETDEQASKTISNIWFCLWSLVASIASSFLVAVLKDGWLAFRKDSMGVMFILENLERIGCIFGLYFVSKLYKKTMVSKSPDIESMYQYTYAMDVFLFYGASSNTMDSLWGAYKMDTGTASRFMTTKLVGTASVLALVASVFITKVFAARTALKKPLAPSSKSSKSITPKINNESLRQMGFDLSTSQIFFSGSLCISAALICLKSLRIADLTDRIFGMCDALEPLYFVWLFNAVQRHFLSLIVNMTSNKISEADSNDVTDLVKSQGKFYRAYGESIWFFAILQSSWPITQALIPVIPGLKKLVELFS